MAGKGVVRSLKNFTKGFSDVQIKVREATSNDAWGPSGTLMNEVAQMTYNQHDFIEVMDMIDKRLNDKGKNWRHVFKALLLLDYCLHVGSENVVLYAKENAYVVKTLKEFQRIEENGKDVGANVRQKAKDIANLLQDDNRLREERRQRQQMRDRMAGVGDYMGEVTGIQVDKPRLPGNDDDQELRKALEESKRQAAEEEQKRKQGEYDDLAKALQLSEQEAREKERKLQEQSSANSNFDALFNPYAQQEQQQQPLQITWVPENSVSFETNTGNNNQQFQSTIVNDAGAFQTVNNPYLQQQQQQNTFPPMEFQSQVQPQVTGFPNTFNHSQQQSTPLFNASMQSPFAQSAFTDPTQQQSLLPFNSPFQTATAVPTGSKNPFSQQASQGSQAFSSFTQQQQQQQQQSISTSIFGQQTPMMANTTTPFDGFTNTTTTTASSSSATSSSLSSPTTTEAIRPNGLPAFHSINSSAPSSPSMTTNLTSTAGQSGPLNIKSDNDPRYVKLNALLGSRDDGMDTFGNTGSLRVPFGTGFANTIKPQENGEMAKAGTGIGLDTPFGLPSRSLDPSSSPSASRNPFGSNENTLKSASPFLSSSSLHHSLPQPQQQQQQQQSSAGSFF